MLIGEWIGKQDTRRRASILCHHNIGAPTATRTAAGAHPSYQKYEGQGYKNVLEATRLNVNDTRQSKHPNNQLVEAKKVAGQLNL